MVQAYHTDNWKKANPRILKRQIFPMQLIGYLSVKSQPFRYVFKVRLMNYETL